MTLTVGIHRQAAVGIYRLIFSSPHMQRDTSFQHPLSFNKPINIDSDLVATCSPNIFFHCKASRNYKKLISRFLVWPERLSFSVRSPRGLIAIIMNEQRHFVFFSAQKEGDGLVTNGAMMTLKHSYLLLTLEDHRKCGQQPDI